jgi:hypothetical protein
MQDVGHWQVRMGANMKNRITDKRQPSAVVSLNGWKRKGWLVQMIKTNIRNEQWTSWTHLGISSPLPKSLLPDSFMSHAPGRKRTHAVFMSGDGISKELKGASS